MQRGFSIIEVTIVVIMIVVLTLLGIASFRSSQASARDDERRTKAETIARAIESMYKNGNTQFGVNPGEYPNTYDVNTAITNGRLSGLLLDIDTSILSYSWQTDTTNVATIGSSANPLANESDTIINSALNTDKIFYEPIREGSGASDTDRWEACYAASHACRRFNIYFKRESDGQRVTIRSMQQ